MTRPSASRGPPASRRLEPTPPDVLLELHIYLVPKEKWLEARRLAKNQVVDDAVSIGFVRVIPELSINNLRREILLQLGPDVIPGDYVFLRSVGRNFTQVKPKQEHQLKAKNFVPPFAPEPEVYLLDVRESLGVPRLVLGSDSPALRISSNNRKREPDENVLPKSCHAEHAPLPPRPSSPPPADRPPSSSPSLSPPAAPSSEDSGILASPPHLPHLTAAVAAATCAIAANPPTSPRPSKHGEDTLNNVRDDVTADRGGYYKDLVESSQAAPPNNKKSINKRSKNKHRKAAAMNRSNVEDFFTSDIEDEGGGGEVSVTFVILEQDERGEGGGDEESDETGTGTPKPRELILTDISEVLRQRRDAERRRHLLVEKATELQRRLRVRREKVSDLLRKNQHALRDQLFAAKKAAIPLEEACARLRLELDAAHRQLLAHLEGRELPLKIRDGPSKKANYKITAARLQHEIKDLQQKVNAVKLRLESETKLKSQAEREVRQLRSDLAQKKVSVSTLRSQMLGTLTTERPARPPFFKVYH